MSITPTSLIPIGTAIAILVAVITLVAKMSAWTTTVDVQLSTILVKVEKLEKQEPDWTRAQQCALMVEWATLNPNLKVPMTACTQP